MSVRNAATGSRANGSPAPGLYVYGASRGSEPKPAPGPSQNRGPGRGVNERFYVNVRAELKARHWSARELARRAGMTPNFLTRVYQGHWIALESAATVADVLGVPLCDLITERDAGRRQPGGAP